MLTRLSTIFIALSALTLLAACSGEREPEVWAYELPNTEVFELHSTDVGQTYEIRVALPDSYGGEDQADAYPLVVLLDADYSFAVARNITQHLAQRERIPEAIVVAIAYPGAEGDQELYRSTRSRDYTPVFSAEDHNGDGSPANLGGGPAFLRFIEDDLLPYFEARYPLHAEDRTLSGHSYGGLFTTWTLLTRPDLFARWIIVSPSYWYADEYIFDYEASFGATNTQLDEVVSMGVGSWENQPENGRPMVDHLNRMAETLQGRTYDGLALDIHVFEEESHASVWPAAFGRGIRWTQWQPLPGTAPETEPADAADPADDAQPPAETEPPATEPTE